MHAVDPKIWKKQAERLTAEVIVERIRNLTQGPGIVTLSGGNPLIHDCTELVDILQSEGYTVAVETQGSIYKDWLAKCDWVTVSPKGPGSRWLTPIEGVKDFFVKLHTATTIFSGRAVLKIVISTPEDLEYASQVAQEMSLVAMYLQPANMTHMDTRQLPTIRVDLLDKLAWLVGEAQKYPGLENVPILPQLHVLLWGNKKGV